MTDEQLTERYISAVRERRDAMYRTALAILGTPSDAEDAVSEAAENTWAHLNSIRNPEAIPTYLMRSAVNAAKGILRRRKREIATEEASVFDREAPQEAPLWEYLGHLPEKYRLPVLMRYGEVLPEQEIAQILRLPRGTVSSRLARGLQILRKQIG